MTVLCSSVSMFRIFHKDVKFVKRGIVDHVLGCFKLYILINVYLAGQSFVVWMSL